MSDDRNAPDSPQGALPAPGKFPGRLPAVNDSKLICPRIITLSAQFYRLTPFLTMVSLLSASRNNF